MLKFFWTSSFILVLFFTCEQKHKSNDLHHSYLKGLDLYTIHCSSCHGIDGQGFRDLYPPLKQSDYLTSNKEQLPCIITQGIEGEIVVNGKTYNQRMIGLNNLKDYEVRDIYNYVMNSWGNDLGYLSDSTDIYSSCN